MHTVNFCTVGIIGFAHSHLNTLRRLEAEGAGVKLWGVVAVDPGQDPEFVEQLKSDGVRVFPSVDAMLDEAASANPVVTLPTGIASHAPLAIRMMNAGHHVYCEKPPAATVQEVDAMIAASRATGKFCAIGFQWLYTEVAQELKRMLVSGELGRVRAAKALAMAFRGRSYYERNGWAGRLKAGDHYVLDGPINNAFAHQLQALLYLAGDDMTGAARVRAVQGELYRSRPWIEGDDTGCLRAVCDGGITVSAWFSHSVLDGDTRKLEIAAEKGTVHVDRGNVTIVERSGRTRTIEQPRDPDLAVSMLNAAEVARGERDRPFCPVECTRSFVLAVNGAHLSSGGIRPVPEAYLRTVENGRGQGVLIEGLEEDATEAWKADKLFSEAGLPWAQPGEVVDVSELRQFAMY